MQLTLGTPGNVGHHWRTKCALSGSQLGEGNGLVESADVGAVEFESEFESADKVDGVTTVDSEAPESEMASSAWEVFNRSCAAKRDIGGKTNCFACVRAGNTRADRAGTGNCAESLLLWWLRSDMG